MLVPGVELARVAAQVMRQIRRTNGEKARINCWKASEIETAFNQKSGTARTLNSQRVAQTSVQVVRVPPSRVGLRQMLASNAELARKLEALEKKAKRSANASNAPTSIVISSNGGPDRCLRRISVCLNTQPM